MKIPPNRNARLLISHPLIIEFDCNMKILIGTDGPTIYGVKAMPNWYFATNQTAKEFSSDKIVQHTSTYD